MRRRLLSLFLLALTTASACAAPKLTIDCGRGKDGFTLAGRDALQQLLVSDDTQRDRTREARTLRPPTRTSSGRC